MKKTLLQILMHNGRLLQRAVEEDLAPIGLHHGQGRLLLAIASCGVTTQADLARQMDIKPATVTNMLKPLEEKKLIHRKLDGVTNRAVLVSLTPAGEKTCIEIQAVWDRIENRMRNRLPDIGNEKVDFFQTLEAIRNSLGGSKPDDPKGF